MNSAIELNKISHQFSIKEDSVLLFKNLDATISTGRSYAIVGPSGIGKSSLLLIMAGLESPVSGSVRYTHQGVLESVKQLRQCSGFVFQQFNLLPEMDAINNIALPLKLKGDKSALEKATKWLENVGLHGRGHHRPAQLSGGEQQRVAIARAFACEPRFVFADEPTGNLDEQTANQIVDLMFECCQQSGAALVFVTHSQALAQRADFLFKLSKGALNVEANCLSLEEESNK